MLAQTATGNYENGLIAGENRRNNNGFCAAIAKLRGMGASDVALAAD